MPGDEIQFGTAYVKVEARLDEYERQMLELEQAEIRSVQRVREFQQQGGGGGGGGFGLGDALLGYSIGRNMGRIRSAIGLTQRMVELVGSLGRGMSRLFWPVTLISEAGRLVRLIRALPDAAERAYNALINLDISDTLVSMTVGVDKFMQRIPLVGHLWNGVAETISQISEGLGFSNFTRDLRELDRQAQAAENRLAGMARAAQLVRDTGLGDAADAARRRGAMAGLTGADAVRAEELFNQQDLVRQAREAGRELYENYMAGVRDLRGQRDAGDLDADQFDAQLRILTDRRAHLMTALERDLGDAVAESRRAAGARLAALEREQQVQRAQETQRLLGDLARARAELELDGADERAEMIRLGYRDLIIQAERDGEARRAAVLGETARLRVQAVRRDERQRWEAQIDEANQGARQTGRSVRDALTELARSEMELRGAPGSALRVFDINADADRSSQHIREQIQELRQAQAEYRRGLPFGLVTDEQHETNNAYARQIEALGRLLELTEALRLKRLDLERQRGDGATGRQISGDEARAYIAAAGAGVVGGSGGSGDGTGREQVRLQQVGNEELKAIRRAIERGGVAVLG